MQSKARLKSLAAWRITEPENRKSKVQAAPLMHLRRLLAIEYHVLGSETKSRTEART